MNALQSLIIIAVDVNECRDGTYNCSENAQCIDEKCGHSCSCQIGYFIEDDNYTCARKFELFLVHAVLNLLMVLLGGFGMVYT